MTDAQTIKAGRTRLIGAVILDLGPVGSRAIRANLIERHGSGRYTDLTAQEIARHIRRYMKNTVEYRKVGDEYQYAIRRGEDA